MSVYGICALAMKEWTVKVSLIESNCSVALCMKKLSFFDNIYYKYLQTTKSFGFVVPEERFQPIQTQDLPISQPCILPDHDEINIIPSMFDSNRTSSLRGDDKNVKC